MLGRGDSPLSMDRSNKKAKEWADTSTLCSRPGPMSDDIHTTKSAQFFQKTKALQRRDIDNFFDEVLQHSDATEVLRITMLVCGGSQPRSLYCIVAFQRRQEGPNHEEQRGATDEFGSRCHVANVRLRERRRTNTVREIPPPGGDRSGIR